MEIEKNENSNLCQKCGGKCCKFYPCHLSPSDVFKDKEPSKERLLEFIKLRHIMIDYWVGNPKNSKIVDFNNYYFLRVATKTEYQDEEKLSSFSFTGGPCFFLQKYGCYLSWDERPSGGKALIPSEEKCVSVYSKKDCAIDWLPYQDMMEEIINELNL